MRGSSSIPPTSRQAFLSRKLQVSFLLRDAGKGRLLEVSHPVLKLIILKNALLYFSVVIVTSVGILYPDNFLSCSIGSLSVDSVRVTPPAQKRIHPFWMFCLFTFILLFIPSYETL